MKEMPNEFRVSFRCNVQDTNLAHEDIYGQHESVIVVVQADTSRQAAERVSAFLQRLFDVSRT